MATRKLKLTATMAAVGVAALLGVATAARQPAEGRGDAPRAGEQWEYRVVEPAEFLPASLHRRAVAAAGQGHPLPAPAGFEVTRASLAQREELLNDFGTDGWELAHVGATELIFKRRR